MKSYGVKITPLFPTYNDVIALTNDFDKYYKSCINEMLNGGQKQFQNYYIAMNQTCSTLAFLDRKYAVPEEVDIKEMREKMYFIQMSKQKWDRLKTPKETSRRKIHSIQELEQNWDELETSERADKERQKKMYSIQELQQKWDELIPN